MMALARYTIRTAAMSESRPSRILEVLNEAILRQTAEQRFCTACFARIMRRGETTRVTIASGGHPLPMILRADGSLETVGKPGTLLGVFEDPTLIDEAIDLRRGDALVMYTDGVTDERRGDENSASSAWPSCSSPSPVTPPRRSLTRRSSPCRGSARIDHETTSPSSR
jgi:serine phosphatase RsbU (regulator of sigma subunit)